MGTSMAGCGVWQVSYTTELESDYVQTQPTSIQARSQGPQRVRDLPEVKQLC